MPVLLFFISWKYFIINHVQYIIIIIFFFYCFLMKFKEEICNKEQHRLTSLVLHSWSQSSKYARHIHNKGSENTKPKIRIKNRKKKLKKKEWVGIKNMKKMNNENQWNFKKFEFSSHEVRIPCHWIWWSIF